MWRTVQVLHFLWLYCVYLLCLVHFSLQMFQPAAVSACRCFSLQMFQPAAVSACRCFSLQLFQPADVSACRCFSLLLFQPADVSACRCFSLQLFQPADVSACRCFSLLRSVSLHIQEKVNVRRDSVTAASDSALSWIRWTPSNQFSAASRDQTSLPPAAH